jgi:hypothetical protein
LVLVDGSSPATIQPQHGQEQPQFISGMLLRRVVLLLRWLLYETQSFALHHSQSHFRAASILVTPSTCRLQMVALMQLSFHQECMQDLLLQCNSMLAPRQSLLLLLLTSTRTHPWRPRPLSIATSLRRHGGRHPAEELMILCRVLEPADGAIR